MEHLCLAHNLQTSVCEKGCKALPKTKGSFILHSRTLWLAACVDLSKGRYYHRGGSASIIRGLLLHLHHDTNVNTTENHPPLCTRHNGTSPHMGASHMPASSHMSPHMAVPSHHTSAQGSWSCHKGSYGFPQRGSHRKGQSGRPADMCGAHSGGACHRPWCTGSHGHCRQACGTLSHSGTCAHPAAGTEQGEE